MSDPRTQSFVISSGGNTSSSILTEGLALVGLDVPAMDANTAKLAVEGTRDLSTPDATATFKPVVDATGAAVVFPVVAATPKIPVAGADVFEALRAVPRIRLVALTAADAAQNQTADRTIGPLFRA